MALWKEHKPREASPMIRETMQMISVRDAQEETYFLGLRMMEGVSKKMFYQNFLVPMETYYQSSLEKCIREGLIKENGDRYCLTDFGIDVSNRVFAEFI